MAKIRVTFSLPKDLMDDVRDAVVYLQRNCWHPATLTAFVEEALKNELKKQTKNCAPKRGFPKRKAELRPGRRID